MNDKIIQYPNGELRNQYTRDVNNPWTYSVEFVEDYYNVLDIAGWCIFESKGRYAEMPRNWTVQW